MRTFVVGCVVAAATLAAAGSVTASPPAQQGCLGETVSVNARSFEPNYGSFIRSVAPRNDLGSIGDAVQAVKAGLVPDELYPNTCND